MKIIRCQKHEQDCIYICTYPSCKKTIICEGCMLVDHQDHDSYCVKIKDFSDELT